MSYEIINADVMVGLKNLDDNSVQCVVTSPPYWGLRDYGVEGQLGLEPTPEEFLERLVGVFREVRRVLRPDGACFVNMGDSYSGSGGYSPDAPSSIAGSKQTTNHSRLKDYNRQKPAPGLKPKDLCGMPWRLALALQADGWWLRSDIIWSKPNPMPESVTDRPTKSHEHIFLLTKSKKYYWDADAVREEHQTKNLEYEARKTTKWGHKKKLTNKANVDNYLDPDNTRSYHPNGRNCRDVWEIATEPCPEAHFATFPRELARRCIVAGSRPGDIILDPFAGAGTTLLVAEIEGRDSVGIELSAEYVEVARRRIEGKLPMFDMRERLLSGVTRFILEADASPVEEV